MIFEQSSVHDFRIIIAEIILRLFAGKDHGKLLQYRFWLFKFSATGHKFRGINFREYKFLQVSKKCENV